MIKHSCTMPDGSKRKITPGQQERLSPDMTWIGPSCKLMMTSACLLFPKFQQISASEPKLSRTAPLFHVLIHWCRVLQNQLAPSLPLKPCWSWRNPIISHSTRLLSRRHLSPSLFFLSSASFRAVKSREACKAEFRGSWSLESIRKRE